MHKCRNYTGLKAITLLLLLLFSSKLDAQKPNVVLIIADDLNTRIGPYMNIDEHTPHLDGLAREGVRFTNAYSQYPLCGPSRASFMSGLYPETTGVLSNNDQPGSYRKETPALVSHPSLAGFFRERGYFTARVSKIFHMGVPGGIETGAPGGDDPDSWDYAYNVLAPETLSPGNLELLSPKNLHYGSNFARIVLPDEFAGTQADYLAASQAIAILENRSAAPAPGATNKQKVKSDAPFFLAVGFVRPHVPFVAPESCFAHYPEERVRLPTVRVGDNVPDEALVRQNEKVWGMNEAQKQQTISAYMASVRFMDQQVGRVLEALDRLALREETIVIFMSDHGYNLGEHDIWSKSSLWEGGVRAPLIISAPGYAKSTGTSCATVTELIDLYPTLLDLCGFGQQKPRILQGKSLVQSLQDPTVTDPQASAYTVTNKGRAASLTTDRWRYSRWGENIEPGNEELYDHRNDPEENVNVVSDPDKSKILQEMRMKFAQARQKARSGS